ncbi:Retinoic acid induced 16-like protein-domain-containing protein [Lipomyces kononenkoae]|uniref:Retinoic acid induced 16-like protein-domain-containing protein n=1 Tax=Lipomyces kononenkoae TaxID=34357 RepID=A0ACC3TD43_LIPKO
MSLWGLWRRQPKDGGDKASGTAAIEKAWVSLTEEEAGLRDGSDSRVHGKVAQQIMEIANIIRAEDQSGTRRICLQYALDHGLFTKIAQITQLCGPSIIKASVAAFSILIKSGEEDLMSNDQVVMSINVFLWELKKSYGDSVLEDEFAEMLFSVASKLRSEPQSLMKWIHLSLSTPVTEVSGVLLDDQPSTEPSSQSRANFQSVAEEDMPEIVYELPPEANTDTLQHESGSASVEPQATPAVQEALDNAEAESIPVEVDEPRDEPRFKTEHATDESATDESYDDAEPTQSVVDETQNDMEDSCSNGDVHHAEYGRDDSSTSQKNVDDACDAIDELISDLRTSHNRDDFPLFYFLLEFIHHEGRAGEFARTGLLYIIELALPSSPLEQWILESDLGTLMASGLGALYSQLSRTMFRAFETTTEPQIVTMAKESERKFIPVSSGDSAAGQDDPQEMEINKVHLQTFLSYLEFWQDTMSHCRSTLIRNTLLDNFETLFLKQLLVPSLADCIDLEGSVSGGAAIAVLTYLRAIFESLDQADIIRLILSSLMVDKDSILPMAEPRPHVMSENDPDGDDRDERIPIKMTATTFSLVDLITDSLKSSSQQTIIAALRLVSTLVRKHYPYTMNTLFQVTPIANGFTSTVTPFNVYAQEMEFFLSLMPANDSDELSSQVYDRYLKDNRLALESHAYLPPSIARSDDLEGGAMARNTTTNDMPLLYSHIIKADDQTWNEILRLFSAFFANSVELNLVLTRVLVDLVSCGWISLRGWLLVNLDDVEVSHARPRPDDDDIDSDESTLEMQRGLSAVDDSRVDISVQGLEEYTEDMSDSEDEYWGTMPEERYEETAFRKLSPMMEVLEALSNKIDEYRKKIPVFDDKLAERRQMLHEDEDQIGDPAAVALSSPLVDMKAKAIAVAESQRFSLSPMDTQQRAEQIYWSSSPAQPLLSLRQPGKYRSLASVSSLSVPRTTRSRLPLPQQQTSPLAGRQHRRAESVAGDILVPPSSAYRSAHKRSQSTFTSSPFLSPTSTFVSDLATPLRAPPALRTMKSDDSLRAFESLMSSPPELTGSSVATRQIVTPALLSASRFSKENRHVKRFGSSPSEFANSFLMNDDSIPNPLASQDEFNDVEEYGGTGRGKMVPGIEMDDIVTDTAYIPTVIQVMGPEAGKSRYVSVAHLLVNVIVFGEFVKEVTAMVQVRSTLIDRVDYGWQRRRCRRG